MSVIEDVLEIIAIYIAIGLLWQLAELFIYGEITPRLIDDVVAIILAILAVSIYNNFH